jgi:hypothetical protein
MGRNYPCRFAKVRRISGLAASLAALCLFADATSGAAGGYIDPNRSSPSIVDPDPPDVRYQKRGSRIVYRSAEPLGSTWQANPEMSRACRRGEFTQRADRRYVALLDKDVYGAAIGGHASLIDKAGLAEVSVLYLFSHQGTTHCRVYHRGQD